MLVYENFKRGFSDGLGLTTGIFFGVLLWHHVINILNL